MSSGGLIPNDAQTLSSYICLQPELSETIFEAKITFSEDS
jgi:hypothetical protein